MKSRSLLIKGIVLSALLVFLFSNTGVVASQKKRAITATGEGIIFNYSEEIYWSEEQFNQEYKNYSENKEKYLVNFIESFSDMFLEAGLKANDWRVSFESRYSLKTKKTTYLTLVQCIIDGAASGTAESPYFRTEWLLMPILPRGIDLYNFKYLTDKILVYEGEVNHTPIKITFKFSKPISHCHYHIWYK
ncbi:hypothetical protein KAT45_04675 [Candidatus Aerophobetes bacterium]|nr:hypothetical protein [Candidatus Aerophobetes bacterium]